MRKEVTSQKTKLIRPSVTVLKVALQDRKSIWRRIAIRNDQTLDDLHEAIFAAFDRDDEHLYSFYFPLPNARGQNLLKGAAEYAHPAFAEESGFDPSPHNAAATMIDNLNLSVGRRFKYLFDFGDNWMHDITVERLNEPADEGNYPRILDSRGESPPQYPDLEELDEDDE